MARKKSQQFDEQYTVLVVDDQDDILDSVETLLRREGLRVICVNNGPEAIEILKREKIDLMLLDYFMPRMTGEEVVREVRKFDRELFILLQTGYAGHKPPLEVLKELDIQGYHDKTEGPDKLLLWIAAGIRSCGQMRLNRQVREGLTCILKTVPQIFKIKAFNDLLEDILINLSGLVKFQNSFIIMDGVKHAGILASGTGRFSGMHVSDLQNLSLNFELIEEAKEKNQVVNREDVMVLPIRNEDKFMGYIYIEGSHMANEEVLDLIKIYVNQAIGAIINMQLHQEVLVSNEKLNESYQKLKKTYYELIESFTKAVDTKDRYTAGHSTRVSLYARIIGRAMGLSREELINLKVASLFHDIGKIGIKDAVLLKEGRLTESEFLDIRTHPSMGCEILAPVSMLEKIIPGILHHHEKYDGQGYPDGLRGEEIPLIARILAVADSFDAMTSNRSYQNKRSYEDALNELERCAGTQFDPIIVQRFTEEFRKNSKYILGMIEFWNHIHHYENEHEHEDDNVERLVAAAAENE